MPYPVQTFNDIPTWENYTNTFWVTNGVQEISGVVGNNVVNGAIKFLKQSPLNWAKVAIYSSGGDIVLSNNFLGTALFITTPPDSLSFGDNFYNEYALINMTASDIPLAGSLVYYDTSGQAVDNIPAHTAIGIFKAANDLWVQGYVTGTGSGRAQKQPKTYFVGTTVGAPTAGTSTWTNPDFKNSYVTVILSRSIFIDLADDGTGTNIFTTKALSSDTLTITNYQWSDGDILSYILITP